MPPSGIPRLRKSVVELGLLLGLTERLAKPRVVERYEVFWVVSRG